MKKASERMPFDMRWTKEASLDLISGKLEDEIKKAMPMVQNLHCKGLFAVDAEIVEYPTSVASARESTGHVILSKSVVSASA